MNNKFSENLKKIRKENNLSQEQLADELGVSRQAISKWESSTAYPEMDKIIALCEKFNLNIDDLLHKDIKEIRGEEESKKKLNKYVDDFLKFITDTINMFSNMSLKSRCKCLIEQIIIAIMLLIICLIIGALGQNLIFIIIRLLPDKLYCILHSIIYFMYGIFAIMSSIIIMVHIFKIRYLDYYEKSKKETVIEKEPSIENKELFKKNENKIIIRDPKHSEYKFINGLFKGIIIITKFFTLCFSIIFFGSLICLVGAFIISFLIYKTGLFFIGLLLVIIASIIINIIIILILLNFIFNRKNDKKKIIWLFISSLIMLGIGGGLIFIGTLNFKYITNDKEILKTEYIELDMSNDLIFDPSLTIEYIEDNNSNIKIEYEINRYCSSEYTYLSNSIIHIWGYCDNPIKLVKEIINNFNNKKIISITNEISNVKIYTTKENIEILKKNYQDYIAFEESTQNMIESYDNRINELQQIVEEYIEKEEEYQTEINELKEQILNQ